MMIDPLKMYNDYKVGLGFKEGDVLVPKDGASPETWSVIENTVVVIRQDALAPHEYTVVGEKRNYEKPSDRFVKFSINGHDWRLK